MAYTLTTDKTWSQTYGELETEFNRWGVRDWEVRCLGRTSRAQYQSLEDRRVSVRWTTSRMQDMRLEMSDQNRAQDNLRVLFLAIQALRLNEVRGVSKVMQDAYLQLASPTRERDPHEVLGLRPDAPMELVEASYRTLAKKLHPDVQGGSAEAFKELDAAYQKLKGGAA